MSALVTLVLIIVAGSALGALARGLRRGGSRALPFVALLGGDLGLVAYALRTPAEPRFPFWAALAGFTMLVLLPQALVAWTRALVRGGRLRAGLGVLQGASALQPGAGHERDAAALRVLLDLEAGRAQPEEGALRALLAPTLDLVVRTAVVEHVLALQLAAGRGAEALALYEEEGGLALATVSAAVAGTMTRILAAAGRAEDAARCAALAEQGRAARRAARVRYWQVAPVATALLGVLLAIHGAVELAGGSDDSWTLARCGANLRAATVGGEPWRLVSSMFLHAGVLHLLINLWALYSLGRLVEQLYGSLRMWIVYMIAGIAGAATSAALGEAYRLSVGASGAIFGLLGGALVAMLRLRGVVHEGWRRSLTYNLLIVIAVNLYIGYSIKAVDNAAHIGGLAGGAVAGMLLLPAPRALATVLSRNLLRAAGYTLAALALAALALAALTPGARTLARIPYRTVERGGVRTQLPTHWLTPPEQKLVAQDPLLRVLLAEWEVELLEPGVGLAEHVAARLPALRERLGRDPSVRDVHARATPSLPPPAPGMAVAESDLVLFDRPHRQIVFFRRAGEVVLSAEIVLPAARVADYAATLARVAVQMRYVRR